MRSIRRCAARRCSVVWTKSTPQRTLRRAGIRMREWEYRSACLFCVSESCLFCSFSALSLSPRHSLSLAAILNKFVVVPPIGRLSRALVCHVKRLFPLPSFADPFSVLITSAPQAASSLPSLNRRLHLFISSPHRPSFLPSSSFSLFVSNPASLCPKRDLSRYTS